MLGRRSQRDFEDEVRSHLEIEAERLRAQGMSAAEAEYAARRNFGNVGVAEDRFYHAQRFVSIQDAARDLRHAWRGLLRTPAFFATAVLTLGLAIGAVTGMFSVVDAVLLKPLAFPHPDRLVWISGTAPGTDLPERFGPGLDAVVHYRERSKLLDGLFSFGGGSATFRDGDRAERIRMAWPTNEMYTTLGVRPMIGRMPVASDGDDAVVISDLMWSTWFNRDPSVIGKWYFVSDSMKQIIGVMPPSFRFPADSTLLWISGTTRLDQLRPGTFGEAVVGRMKPGVTTEQLARELTALARELPARFGGSPAYQRIIAHHQARVDPMRKAMMGDTTERSLWVLLGAVGVVLLVACANVANLFMVRAETRTRDMALRCAIGASRLQLVRFQLAEAFVVAVTGGVLAVLLSRWTMPLFIRSAPPGIPRLDLARNDAMAPVAAFALVVLAALACGIMPALRASSPNLLRLREGGRGSTGRGHFGRDALVVTQTALALVLLIASALLVQSFNKLRHVDPGYRVDNLYTFQFAPQQESLHDGPTYGRMHLDFMNRLRGLPGVTDVGLINNLPLDEGTSSVPIRREDMASDDATLMQVNIVGGDVFRALGVKLLEGRPFTNDEALVSTTNVILSKSAAEKLWPGQHAVGRRVFPKYNGKDTLAFTVIGVVGDVKQLNWKTNADAMVYFPLTGPLTPRGVNSPAYVVRSPRAEQLKPEVRQLVRQIAPEAPVYREFTMDFLARRSMTDLTFTMLTLGVVSGLALFLGAIGLYGVLSYVVAERTREIGVRMALGATARAVRAMVVSQGTKVVVIGVAIGVAVALLTTRLLEKLLFDVKAVNPVVFAAMSVVMLAIGAIASYVPARRASSVNPIESLRSD